MTEPDAAVRAVMDVVRPHLHPGERMEHVTAARVRVRIGFLVKFFGLGPGKGQPLVLTTQRLLALRPGAGADARDWLDLQLERRRLAADEPATVGGAVVVEVQTGLGSRVLLFRRDREAEARRLVAMLRGARM